MKRLKKVLHTRRGFTLIESVLGLLLFSIMMTLVASLFVTSSRILIRTQQAEQAVNAVISQSETAGYDLASPYEPIQFQLDASSVELRLVTYEAETESESVQLRKFVYAAPAAAEETP